jgi:hypothetical protein
MMFKPSRPRITAHEYLMAELDITIQERDPAALLSVLRAMNATRTLTTPSVHQTLIATGAVFTESDVQEWGDELVTELSALIFSSSEIVSAFMPLIDATYELITTHLQMTINKTALVRHVIKTLAVNTSHSKMLRYVIFYPTGFGNVVFREYSQLVNIISRDTKSALAEYITRALARQDNTVGQKLFQTDLLPPQVRRHIARIVTVGVAKGSSWETISRELDMLKDQFPFLDHHNAAF